MKNYTSEVPAERTISRIEQILASAGAKSIQKEYEDGQAIALIFTLPTGGQAGDVSIKLPANAAGVEAVFMADVKKPRKETLNRVKAQALRTAWKIMQDWTEIQISLIELHQAEPAEVFLPYIWDGKRTIYTALKAGGFKLLAEGKKHEG
jgi:hypothetical protein